MKDYTVIIQARMGSNRRPGKINYLFNDEPMLVYQINRLKAFGITNIIVATSNKQQDDVTEQLVTLCGVECFRGSEDDVLKRFNDCCEKFKIKNVIRVGGDDPLIDPEGIKLLIKTHQKNLNYDLIYSSHPDGWIYGTAAELITAKSLCKANEFAKDNIDREHIIPYYKKNSSLRKIKLNAPIKLHREDIYLSVDYQEDLDLIEQILNYFTKKNKRYTFTQQSLIELYDSGLLKINNKHLHSGF
jgi:spore coat polysaccharide biosynthesis protein SpsF